MIRYKLTLFTIWTLLLTGCLAAMLSPIARYITGDEFWLWIVAGTGGALLILAYILTRVVEILE